MTITKLTQELPEGMKFELMERAKKKNNLNVPGVKEIKERLVKEATFKEEIREVIEALRKTHNGRFLDTHNDQMCDPVKQDVTFVLLDAEHICPMVKTGSCSLNMMYVDGLPKLSMTGVGGIGKYSELEKMYDPEEGYVTLRVIEEIDVNTFDVDEYFKK